MAQAGTCACAFGVQPQGMPQIQLPLFGHGVTLITPELAFERREQSIFYFNGQMPVFTHPVADVASFRLFTSQLIVTGTATQGQIVKAFGVPLTTVKRAVKKLRAGGAAAFFVAGSKREGSKLTVERLAQAQGMLDAGQGVPAISQALGVLGTTLHKAIDDGRLVQKKSPLLERPSPS